MIILVIFVIGSCSNISNSSGYNTNNITFNSLGPIHFTVMSLRETLSEMQTTRSSQINVCLHLWAVQLKSNNTKLKMSELINIQKGI